MRESIKTTMSKRFADNIVKKRIMREFDSGFAEMIRVNVAYAITLAECGFITRKDAKEIIAGFRYVEAHMTREDCKPELEDFYFNIERRMFDRVGSKVGGKLHMGRSRNDIGATLNRMVVRKSVWEILDLLLELKELLIQKAAENTDTVMTGYTHSQPGQPITLGHYYTALNSALNRDFQRILNAYHSVNLSPYGAAAFAGTSFPVDRQMLSDLLGFDDVLENTIDCISARDYYAELAAAFSILATNISRAAEDMNFWATFENGILEIGGEVAVCSSIMPQKRNPVSLEMAKAKSGHIISGLAGILTLLKGTCFSNTMDLPEVPVPYWNTVEQVKQMLICMIESVTYCTIRKDRARRQAAENLCTVTSLADYMVKTFGISFTDAHDIVGNIVSVVIEEGSYISGFTPERIRQESRIVLDTELHMTEEEILSVLEPFGNVETKTNIGGPSRTSVKAMIAKAERILQTEKEELQEIRSQVEASEQTLAQKEEELAL